MVTHGIIGRGDEENETVNRRRMIKTIDFNWLDELKQELPHTRTVRIVSPFIKENIVNQFLEAYPEGRIQLITRFNLNDFRSGGSSISALERLLERGSEIKGIEELHSKLYLFDERSVIITSANFTNGGFFRNKEFGIKSDDINTVKSSVTYFNELWGIENSKLTVQQLEEWKLIVRRDRSGDNPLEPLPDFGKSYQHKVIGSNRKYFIKFFGKGDYRLPLSHSVRNEIRFSCSHFALSFSRNKRDSRPRRYQTGDIVYMAMITDTYDYAIFGKAEAVVHDDKRDIANDEDINAIDWLAEWPILVRVTSPVFIDTTLSNCPKMNNLIEELGSSSFESTRRRYNGGERNIEPKKSLKQKADVQLSDLSALWLEERFLICINENGSVPESVIASLYQGRPL